MTNALLSALLFILILIFSPVIPATLPIPVIQELGNTILIIAIVAAGLCYLCMEGVDRLFDRARGRRS